MTAPIADRATVAKALRDAAESIKTMEHALDCELRLATTCENLATELSAPAPPPAPPPLDEHMLWILGRPNFSCAGIADLLRTGGRDIPRKSELEQAHVLHWMMTHYMRSGIGWRMAAEDELHNLAAIRVAQRMPKDGKDEKAEAH